MSKSGSAASKSGGARPGGAKKSHSAVGHLKSGPIGNNFNPSAGRVPMRNPSAPRKQMSDDQFDKTYAALTESMAAGGAAAAAKRKAKADRGAAKSAAARARMAGKGDRKKTRSQKRTHLR